MTRYIAVSNRRGGVGKTTTTMMLGYGLSVLGFQRVLIVDLDAQASTSITMMGYERWALARRQGHTIGDILVEMYGQDKIDLRGKISRQVGDVHIMPGRRRPDLDLLPCTFELDNRERELLLMGANAGPTVAQVFERLQTRVAQILRSLEGHYDVVLMDCPPGLSNTAWGALQAADFVLVPYVPDATAQDNIGWFHKELMRQNPDQQVRVLPNRVRPNSPFQAGIMDTVHQRYDSIGIAMPVRSAIAGALDFRTNSEPLRAKFGDGTMVVEALFNAVLQWFEQAPGRRSATPTMPGNAAAATHDEVALLGDRDQIMSLEDLDTEEQVMDGRRDNNWHEED